MIGKLNVNAATVSEFMVYLWREYTEKGCRQQAAALTYVTLFGVVPLLTLVFTMFSLFPAFEGMSEVVQAFLFEHLLPDSGLEIQQYLDEFTQQARRLTLVGLLILMVTAFLMIKNIEVTFNAIWGTEGNRRGITSFLIYWAILSIGPLLLGIGLAMSTYVLSLKLFVREYDSLGLIPALFSFFPWILTSVAFTLLFAAVPNCKVPFRHALAGGALTAVCFEFCKDLFAWIVAHTSFTAVYGAFAMVPLLLMWIYLLWMIVLVGALFVRTLSTFRKQGVQPHYPDLLAALIALWVLRQNHQSGLALQDEQLLAENIEAEQWQHIRDALHEERVITLTADGDYILCRDLNSFTLRQLARAVGLESPLADAGGELQNYPWFAAVGTRLRALEESMEHEFNVSIGAIFAQQSGAENGAAMAPETASKPSRCGAEAVGE